MHTGGSHPPALAVGALPSNSNPVKAFKYPLNSTTLYAKNQVFFQLLTETEEHDTMKKTQTGDDL